MSKIQYTSSVNYKPILIGALAVALVAVGYLSLHQRQDTTAFTVVCPAASYSMAEKLTAAYADLHPEVTMDLSALADEECTAEHLSERLDSGKTSIAFLPAAISPADLDSARLMDVRGIYHAAAAQLAVSSQAEAPLYALPLAGQADVLLYHPKQLKQAGGAAPRSWNEFFATLNFLGQTDKIALRLESLEEDSYGRLALLDTCLTYGSPELGTDAVSGNEANAGLDLYNQLVASFAECEGSCAEAVSHDRALTSFKKNGCAMVFATSAEYAALKKAGVDCAAVPISGLYDEVHYAVTPTCSVAVSAKAEGENVSKFLTWLLQKDAQEIVSAETGDFPMAAGIADSKAFPDLVVRTDDTDTSAALLSSLWQANASDRQLVLTASLEQKGAAA